MSDWPDSENWLSEFDSAGLALLSPEELEAYRQLTAGITPRLWAPRPQNRPQQTAYHSDADVLGYGGAAGGGKSDLLLGLAFTAQKRSLILRREGKQLRALIDRSREIVGDRGRFNENTGIWRDLPGDRQVELGGVKDVADVHNHKGRPKDFLGIDEADQFTEYMVRFLMGWVRTTDPQQPCRVVLTFNPPSTAEGRWLLDFFAPWLIREHPNPAKSGEVRWFARLPDGREVERPDRTPFTDGGETVTPKSRAFVQALVTDNPDLMATGYPAQLQALPEPLRSQLLKGDMHAGLRDDTWQMIPTEWVRAAQARWRPDGHGNAPVTGLGVDVAWGGADKTVLAARHRAWFAPLRKHPGKATPDGQATKALILLAMAGQGAPSVAIDTIGYGASTFDQCKGEVPGLVGVDFAAATEATDRSGKLHFVNLRAWAYWAFREALDPERGDNLALPPDPELLADLTAGRWEMTVRGVKLEAKEDIKARIGRSPDCADAVVIAHLARPAPPQARPAAGTLRSPAYDYRPR
jgi:hypothetical protein